jgi:protein-tyrosine phosphatase
MASIILLTLGVDQKTVKEEYLMSNFYRYELNQLKMKKGRRLFIGKGTLESAFIVQEAYIDAVFEVIDKKYNGIENYLELKFGISPEQRRWLIDQYTFDPEEITPKIIDQEIQQ